MKFTSTLISKAHQITRATLLQGDDYRITFGAALRALIAEANSASALTMESLEAEFNRLQAESPRRVIRTFYLHLQSIEDQATVLALAKKAEAIRAAASRNTYQEGTFITELSAYIF